MGRRLANLTGGETSLQGNAKKKIIIDGHTLRVEYVDPEADDGLWENVTGDSALFVDGVANPLKLPRSDEVQDSLDDTSWISPTRYKQLAKKEAWQNALDTEHADDLLQMVKILIGIAGLNFLGIALIASQVM